MIQIKILIEVQSSLLTKMRKFLQRKMTQTEVITRIRDRPVFGSKKTVNLILLENEFCMGI